MKAGVARVNITPEHPIWMAGYAARTKPSEGKYHDLFAKALVLEDGDTRVAIITSDLIGFDPAQCDEVKSAIESATGLLPSQVILSASHTHTGPEIRPEGQHYVKEVDNRYAAELTQRIVVAVEEASRELEEITLDFSSAACTLTVNRRLPTDEGMVMRPNPEGVTDPNVSVVRALRGDGSPLAIIFSYPCPPTTLGDYLIGADYPGYAQDVIEEAFEGCTAMFMLGCAGDQKVRHVDGRGNFKSGPHQVAQSLGEELARAVLLAVGGKTTPVPGSIRMALDEVELPLQPPPTREEAERWLNDANQHRVEWAKEMLRLHEEGGEFQRSSAFTIQTLTVGDFALIGLSGEMCVDYSLRLKAELSPRPVLVAGYTNGMVGYIPTASMIPDGGYEVDGSYFYSLRPAPYAAEVEEDIVQKVRHMLSS